MSLAPHPWFLASLKIYRGLILAFCVGLIPVLSFAGQNEDYIWETQEESVIVLQYHGAGGTVVVPDHFDGLPVTQIGAGAFSNGVTITNLTLPDTVVRLGDGAFSGCTSLLHIELGSGVVELGDELFYRCLNLTDIALPPLVSSIPDRTFNGCIRLRQFVVPDSVTRIGTNAFAGCSRLEELTFGAGLKVIDAYAFYGCSSLSLLDFPHGLASIGEHAFQGCTGLLAISLPHSVTNLGSRAFIDCRWLAAVAFGNGLQQLGESVFSGCTSLMDIWVSVDNLYFTDEDGVLFNRDHSELLQFPPGRAGVFVVPSGVANIAPYAFSGCAFLQDVTLPAGIKKISDYAFYGCTALTNVVVANTLESLGNYAFAYCSQLICVYFKGLPPTLSGANVFFGTPQAVVFHQPGSAGWADTFGGQPVDIWYEPAGLGYEIHDAGITITKYAGTEGGVAVPAFIHGRKVVAIGAKAFQDNQRLGSVLLPEGVESIGISAFARCGGLTNLSLPASLMRIDSYAFSDCRTLKEVGLPEGVNDLGDGAFYRCTQLRRVGLPAGLALMGLNAFAGCTSLAEVVVPFGVAQIGSRAFSDCSQLTAISLPSTVVHLGVAPFYNCAALTNITVDSGNLSFFSQEGVLFDRAGRNLLAYPPGRAGVYSVPAGVTNIDYAAFCHAEGLTGVTLPAGLLAVGYMAFYDCSRLATLVLPSSVKTLANYSFSGCTALTQLCYEDDAPVLLGDYAFFNAPQLTNYFVPGMRGWGSGFGGRPAVPWPVRFDQWAVTIGLTDKYPDAHGLNDDPDHDGLSNVQEMAAGTDPNDPESVLRFESEPRVDALSEEDQLPVAPGQWGLYFRSVPGKRYELYSGATVQGPWTSVANLAATTTQKRVLLSWPVTNAVYRVKLSQ